MNTNMLGAVVIGRNEGHRLKICLESLMKRGEQIVYVDSGSTDQSVSMARSLGVTVVELDISLPFTASRARNKGFEALISLVPQLKFVQFIDGDCEIIESWLEVGKEFLENHSDVAIVSGVRKERYPERSVYNWLCDSDWLLPVGETSFCGGDAMMRVNAFTQVKGFRDSLIAGEEPELCVRMRLAGWKVWRLDEPMTLHDAAILHFSQWWKRTMRGGYAYAEGAAIHGKTPFKHFVRQTRRILIWGCVLPLLILVSSMFNPLLLFGFLIYPVQICRLAWKNSSQLFAKKVWIKAVFFTIARFPEAIGMLRFYFNRINRRSALLIEYK